MTTIRSRSAEYPVAQGITRADEMAASDRRALLAAGDALAEAVQAAIERDPEFYRCMACATRTALVRWLEVTGER